MLSPARGTWLSRLGPRHLLATKLLNIGSEPISAEYCQPSDVQERLNPTTFQQVQKSKTLLIDLTSNQVYIFFFFLFSLKHTTAVNTVNSIVFVYFKECLPHCCGSIPRHHLIYSPFLMYLLKYRS